ncbi:MAG TPA: hypothetical protein VK806_09075 [Bacteroidia bacterium]|jgi:hypothetical protein|nr:hypothetical protein [Bacteroidia bacterium]
MKTNMSDKQIEEKLQEIESRNPQLFKQFKLKDHIFWTPIPGTDKIKWGIHPHFVGNLPFKLKVEIGKIMNKMTKGGYVAVSVAEKSAV